MPSGRYKKASILKYEHGDRLFCCVEHLAFFDDRFAYDLKTNERLRTVFEKMTASDNDPVTEDLDEFALLYIERGLMNRAHIACAQKSSLQICYQDVPSEETRNRVQALVDEDLQYVLNLMQRFDSPTMSCMKERVSLWIETDPSVRPLESDDEVSSEDDEMVDSEDDERGYHAGNVIMGNHQPDIIPVDD